MFVDKVHLRYCMLYEFRKGKSAVHATKAICYGSDAPTTRAKLVSEVSKDEDEARTERPEKLQTDDLEALLEEDPRQTTPELGEKLGVDATTVLRRLHAIGKIQKIGK